VNIAYMRIFRESKGEKAYTIVESDQTLPDDLPKQIKTNSNVMAVMLIQK